MFWLPHVFAYSKERWMSQGCVDRMRDPSQAQDHDASLQSKVHARDCQCRSYLLKTQPPNTILGVYWCNQRLLFLSLDVGCLLGSGWFSDVMQVWWPSKYHWLPWPLTNRAYISSWQVRVDGFIWFYARIARCLLPIADSFFHFWPRLYTAYTFQGAMHIPTLQNIFF